MALINDRRVSTPNLVHNGLCGVVCIGGLILVAVSLQWLLSLITF